MSAKPLLITLAPAGTGVIRIEGFSTLLLDPFQHFPSSCHVPLSVLHAGAEMLLSSLRTIPAGQPVALYGEGPYGTLAVFTLSRTDRISAAIILGALVDPLSALGLTDTVPPDPAQDIQSRIFSLAQDCALEEIRSVQTPLLILHGEEDALVPSAQADELFALMKTLHPELPSRLVLFPSEGHSLTDCARERAIREICRFLTSCMGGEGRP